MNDLEGDGDAGAKITGAVVSLAAHALELRVVGEGIETSLQLESLRALGCDIGQGYYFSRPLTRDAMDELLAENPRW